MENKMKEVAITEEEYNEYLELKEKQMSLTKSAEKTEQELGELKKANQILYDE